MAKIGQSQCIGPVKKNFMLLHVFTKYLPLMFKANKGRFLN